MPTREYIPRKLLYPQSIALRNFSGGLNLRAAPSELAANETPACQNVTFDERGGLVKRLGLSRLNSSDGAATGYKTFYYSPVLNLYLVQDGTTLYKTTDFNTLTSLTTFSTNARVGFCDFATKAIIVHPVDGVFSYDGSSYATISTSVKGSCCAPWQNKLWVGGDPTQPPRLYFGAAGVSDSTTFTATGSGTNDLREIDMNIITNMEVTSYLLVTKDTSCYRVTDSSTGTYTSISASAGASGNNAMTVLGKTFAMMNEQGIWLTDGISSPVNAAEKIRPLFDKAQVNFSQFGLVAAGHNQNRMVFSFPYGAAQATNNRTLEFHPTEGWFTIHTFGCTAYTNPLASSGALYGTDPAKKNFYEVFKTGADNGSAITANFQTPWLQPWGDFHGRMSRIELAKRGAFSLYVKSDWDTGQGQLFSVAAAASGITWDGGHTWDDGSTWSQTNYEDTTQIYPYILSESVSFVISESSSTSASNPLLLGDGVAPEVGNFAVYGITFQTIYAGQ